MISVIICSINKERLEAFKRNVTLSIGVEHEFIAWDNKTENFGITKVYNMCAEKAKYDCLCFAHEDIAFHTPNWGKIIIDKLKEPDCGVIGFGGSRIKSAQESGWEQLPCYNRRNYIQSKTKGRERRGRGKFYNNLDYSIDFEKVITLDGLCLFADKNKWRECKFDENILTGFHGYDLDFTLQMSLKYQNYVCNRIIVEHFSSGRYNRGWVEDTIKLHEKWHSLLPKHIDTLSQAEIKKNEKYLHYMFVRTVIKSNYPLGKALHIIFHYVKKDKNSKRLGALIARFFVKRVLKVKS